MYEGGRRRNHQAVTFFHNPVLMQTQEITQIFYLSVRARAQRSTLAQKERRRKLVEEEEAGKGDREGEWGRGEGKVESEGGSRVGGIGKVKPGGGRRWRRGEEEVDKEERQMEEEEDEDEEGNMWMKQGQAGGQGGGGGMLKVGSWSETVMCLLSKSLFLSFS